MILYSWKTVIPDTSDCQGVQQKYQPGDSNRDPFILRLEVTESLWKGHVNSPSQKGHDRRIAR